MTRPRLGRSVLSGAVVLAVFSVIVPAASGQTNLSNPPPGANNFACRPSAAHPDPVVLVHGTFATMGENWGEISPLLAKAGYCVFALTYGERTGTVFSLFQIGGLTPMEQSSAELARFVDTVLGATGAAKVDIVGHSQGSLMPDYYAKYLGGGSKIGKYVGIAPLWDGSTASGLAELYALGAPSGLSGLLLDSWCQSCHEFLAGSDFIKKMNANGGPRVPGIAYTMLMTDHDEAVTPYTSGYMAGATNIVLQNVCPDDFSEHVAMAFDTNVDQLLLNALDPAHAKAVHCGNVFTTYF